GSGFTCCQVDPRSSERYTAPESGSISAHTRAGLAGETAIPMFPHRPVGSPGFLVSSVQCSPASVDLNSPLPAPPDTSVQGRRTACHRPAYSTFGLVGSRTRSAAPVESFRNRTLFQVLPPSVVL